jgi:hypothetical protein
MQMDVTGTTRERPILFSGPMVRAILDGRKTQTRRVVKPQPDIAHWQYIQAMHGTSPPPDPVKFGDWRQWRRVGPDYPDGKDDDIWCPYADGDRLWVREAFCYERDPVSAQLGRPLYRADGANIIKTDDDGFQVYNKDGYEASPWVPSIHMPRAVSRLTLEVVNVRVERLQGISEQDAKAEGCDVVAKGLVTARELFEQLWDGINAKRAPWASNPWVWVVEFRVHSKSLSTTA